MPGLTLGLPTFAQDWANIGSGLDQHWVWLGQTLVQARQQPVKLWSALHESQVYIESTLVSRWLGRIWVVLSPTCQAWVNANESRLPDLTILSPRYS